MARSNRRAGSTPQATDTESTTLGQQLARRRRPANAARIASSVYGPSPAPGGDWPRWLADQQG